MRLAIPSDQRIAAWLGLRLSESTLLLLTVLVRALLVGAGLDSKRPEELLVA
jgi:hypothetical protein